jgi:hypothetical protein
MQPESATAAQPNAGFASCYKVALCLSLLAMNRNIDADVYK